VVVYIALVFGERLLAHHPLGILQLVDEVRVIRALRRKRLNQLQVAVVVLVAA
jgi:hypothetical protein